MSTYRARQTLAKLSHVFSAAAPDAFIFCHSRPHSCICAREAAGNVCGRSAAKSATMGLTPGGGPFASGGTGGGGAGAERFDGRAGGIGGVVNAPLLQPLPS